ncbi:MAG: DUF1282 family protein [Hyphomonadaceae bacterium]|nr:DUF1282 family protein [Hyphomonadaceae bacterium]
MSLDKDEADEAEAAAGAPRPPGPAKGEARQKAEFILSRAYGLLREPKSEWRQIRDEETNIPSLMLGYVAPLAAVPPLAGLVGGLAFDRGLTGTPAQLFVGAVITFLVFMALIFFLGYLIGAIAENFEGERNELAAMKVAAFAPTPAFLLGMFSVWPPFWWVGLIGVAVSAFLLFRGLPILMKAPEDRALSYAATVAVTGLIALVVLGVLTSCVTGIGRL